VKLFGKVNIKVSASKFDSIQNEQIVYQEQIKLLHQKILLQDSTISILSQQTQVLLEDVTDCAGAQQSAVQIGDGIFKLNRELMDIRQRSEILVNTVILQKSKNASLK